ncbi:4366_t:CDS:2 [Racocetra persica]|uniref:4366_t:CDS:1 n=1 Tax=Racocetra persica TaxID=160502 RepID=A0ACA9L814_9GLOM|nr:4366_t:CDS:2 [Racocetra persica]
MVYVPKNGGLWGACTGQTITYLDFSLVYSLSGTPTVPAVGNYTYGKTPSTVDHHGFIYALYPQNLTTVTNSCGTNTTVCRFVTYRNYSLPRNHYCVIVGNPNNVDYYLTMVYSFGGTSARRSINSPKKSVYERQLVDFEVAGPEVLNKFQSSQV